MAELEWIFLCEYALLDQGNKLSMLGEFTSVYFAKFPATFPSLYVVTRWQGEKGETLAESLRVSGPDGKTIAELSTPSFSLRTKRQTNLHKFELLSLPKPDKYFIEVYKDGELAGKERFFARSRDE